MWGEAKADGRNEGKSYAQDQRSLKIGEEKTGLFLQKQGVPQAYFKTRQKFHKRPSFSDAMRGGKVQVEGSGKATQRPRGGPWVRRRPAGQSIKKGKGCSKQEVRNSVGESCRVSKVFRESMQLRKKRKWGGKRELDHKGRHSARRSGLNPSHDFIWIGIIRKGGRRVPESHG